MMTTIARLSAAEAYILKGRLEAEGIPAFVLDEHANAGLPVEADSFAGMRVQVPDEYAAEAAEVFRSVQQNNPPAESEERAPNSFVRSVLSVDVTIGVLLTVGVLIVWIWLVWRS